MRLYKKSSELTVNVVIVLAIVVFLVIAFVIWAYSQAGPIMTWEVSKYWN